MTTVKRWLPAVIIMMLISALSSVQGVVINDAGLGDNRYHITGHFMMFFFLYFAYYKATKNKLESFFLVVAYALIDEFHQKYTPGRSSSIEDMIVDSLAGGAGALILWNLYQKLPRIFTNWLEK